MRGRRVMATILGFGPHEWHIVIFCNMSVEAGIGGR